MIVALLTLMILTSSIHAYVVKPLSLYEMNELKRVWYDRGSGADVDCSIWRSDNIPDHYPVGDIVVATHAKPHIGLLLRPSNKGGDAVRPPVSYHLIWTDAGSGANQDVRLWSPICPAGYVALGYVATNGPLPRIGDIYCVKKEYTIKGSNINWRRTWADHGSGADRDVTIYEAIAKQSNQQSVRGFGAVANYHVLPPAPHMLNKRFVTYHAEKPIMKIHMYSVVYHLSSIKLHTEPIRLHVTAVINPSVHSTSVRRSVSFSTFETKSFNTEITHGISMEITTGFPIISAGHTTTISQSTTTTIEAGSTITKTHTDTMQFNINVPARSKITAFIQGTKVRVDVPFAAIIKKIYYDGSYALGRILGVYKGVAISDIKVTYGAIESIG